MTIIVTAAHDFDTSSPSGLRTAIYGDDPTYLNHFAPKNPAAFFGFSSVEAFTDYIDRLPPELTNDPRRSGWETDDGSWRGSSSMEAAVRIARQGWQDGTDRALELIDSLSLDNPRVRRRSASIAGGMVNVGRMLSGDPKHMIRRPKQPGRKIVTFFVEAGCQAVIDSENMITRAALVGAMVDIMENVGYSCAVVATDTSLNGYKTMYQLAVKIKDSGERVNLSDMMFALGHPSFLRRLSFGACSSAIECRDIWVGQGSPANAFTNDHPCAKTEFYVPVLTLKQQNALTDDPFSMLPFVTPKGLPIKIERH